jgi:hypothetical protein
MLVVGLMIIVEKPKCILLSYHENVVKNRNVKIANRSFENVAVQIFHNESNI